MPYLLARAYGGPYLWDCLHGALRRRPMDLERPTRNAARRMNTLAHNLPKNRVAPPFDLREEVVFFLAFLSFAEEYNTTVAKEDGSNQAAHWSQQQQRRATMGMRPWKELLALIEQGSPDEAHFATPAELGFACGALLRRFSRWYFKVTEKNFLQHRVMTYGSDLSPEVVWKRGLNKLFDVEARYPSKIHIPADYRQKVGVVLVQLEQKQEEVRRQRDDFMTGFWAGYTLSGPAGTERQEE